MGQDNQNQNQSQRNSQTGTQQQQPGRSGVSQPGSTQQDRSSDAQRGKFGDRKQDQDM